MNDKAAARAKARVRLAASASLGALLLVGAVGCGGAVTNDSDGPDGPEATDATSERLTRTIVHLHGDGSEDVQTSEITVAEQGAEKELRLQMEYGTVTHDGKLGSVSEGIAQDGSCAGSSIWLFSGANRTGQEICFYGAGTANLNNYQSWCFNGLCHIWGGTGFLATTVMSYWPGADYGRFSSDSSVYCGSPSTCPQFPAYGPSTNTSSCEQQAWFLRLGQACSPPTLAVDTSYATTYTTGSHYTPNTTATVRYYRGNGSLAQTVNASVNSSGNLTAWGPSLTCVGSTCTSPLPYAIATDSQGFTSATATIYGSWY